MGTVLAVMAIVLCGCGGGGTTAKPATTTTLMTTSTTNTRCLCVFDVDRTLTASQTLDCADTTVKQGIQDNAYGGGTLKLSQLATNMGDTFCSRCYRGIVTRGDASGEKSKERALLFSDVVGPMNYTLSETWEQWQQGSGGGSQDPNWHATSSLVYFTNDGFKNQAVKSVVEEFFLAKHNILISDYNVHFFDDRADNIKAFEGTPYNAHQVACAARDPAPGRRIIGQCGGRVEEIVESKGGVTTYCSTHEEQVVV